MRFKVKKALYPHGTNNDSWQPMNLIVDDDIPCTEINRHLVLLQISKEKPLTTSVYYLCIYLNYLDEHGLEVMDVKMSDIQDFLQELYIDSLPYAGKGAPCSYSAIQDYIEVLSKLYDNLSLRGYKMDESLYLIDVRGNIKTNSNAFFIGRNGKPVTYQAYRAALESARVEVNKKYGWNIEALHTHAGRSTFAAALRTYQLDCRRNGIPTFSDVDFCNLMDWKSLDSLKHYDLINRIHEISPLIKELYSDFDSIVEKNGNLISTEVERV